MAGKKISILIIGGGAAGFFAAIRIAELQPEAEVTLLESSPNYLGKVRISGGGRCNLTNACFEPKELVKNYPRGEKALLGPFNRFHVQHTMDWFEGRGVKLKTEADGRVFPVSNNSREVVDCLVKAANDAGVKCWNRTPVAHIIAPVGKSKEWKVQVAKGPMFSAQKILIATGSNFQIWDNLKRLGHTIEKPIPSLFTFNINDRRIEGLAGISMQDVACEIDGIEYKTKGPLLISHWGLTGPVILRLSAWAAREIQEKKYLFSLKVNFSRKETLDEVIEAMTKFSQVNARKKLITTPVPGIPGRFWERLVQASRIRCLNWADLSKEDVRKLSLQLFSSDFWVNGKSTNKDEFVTCGGVNLDEVDFRTMESRKIPGIYFAGEVLDIDAITGGFNFQAAWTTAWLAAEAMASANSD